MRYHSLVVSEKPWLKGASEEESKDPQEISAGRASKSHSFWRTGPLFPVAKAP